MLAKKLLAPVLFATCLFGSGCEQPYGLVQGSTPNSNLCVLYPDAQACKKTPMVTTPGVVTILFTMEQIPQGSGTLILANAIKYASPKADPKILFLTDSDLHGEDMDDGGYIKNTLLLGYRVDYNIIVSGGLDPSSTNGYDLIIVHNPGYPLQDVKSRDTLAAFSGGVILVGDDMAQGNGFNMESLTGLHFTDNGTTVTCNGQSYRYDNLQGYNYQVAMSEAFFPGIPDRYKNYQYGNDIDHADANTGVQVLATAQAAPNTCNIGIIPTVVRKPK